MTLQAPDGSWDRGSSSDSRSQVAGDKSLSVFAKKSRSCEIFYCNEVLMKLSRGILSAATTRLNIKGTN
jgi:hypothetical protein